VSPPEVNCPAWLDRAEYPFEPRYFELDAGRLHYVDEGAGPPVVMVHGNPAWSFLYRNLIKRLSRGHRCLALDHIGFGLSDKPAGWSYRPEDHARNLEAFIQSLGLRDITLVVQDWGGPIGLSYAISHPEKVGRLIITNTWMWPVNRDPCYWAFSRFMGSFPGRLLIRRWNFFASFLMPRMFGDRSRLPPEIHRQYLAPLGRPEERKGCWVFPREILRSSDWLGRLWTSRKKIAEKPALILWGMKDIAFRKRELNRWAELFPQARVVKFPTAGHFLFEECGEELYRPIEDFLRGQ